ncbi:MAG: hypothetical protein ACLP52_11205 [Streptosporangiaceae bacterium]
MARATHERARVANAIRHHPDDHEAIAAARADLAVASIEDFIERKLAEAPRLSGEQVGRLRALLPPAGDDHAA